MYGGGGKGEANKKKNLTGDPFTKPWEITAATATSIRSNWHIAECCGIDPILVKLFL